MSDDPSAPRGRYAKPRRRAYSEKARARGADVPSGLFEDPHRGQPEFDDGYADPATPPAAPADLDYGYGDEQQLDDGYAAPEAAQAPEPEPIVEHDYLDRDGAAGAYRPEYDAPAPDIPYAAPAQAEAFERRPLRDRSLPAPTEDGRPAETALAVEADASLVVSGIGKTFKRRPVVRDVSLEVRRGEIVGLLGPNGAGKTTCFYMITGLIPADRGAIRLMGQDLTRYPMFKRARMGLGYLPQEASIFRGLTVEQNIRATLELSEPSPHRREARLDQLLAEFSISRLRRSPAVALSGGERRRVEIARALAANPAFVLLDEPFAGVDPIAVGDIRSLVWQLKDRGIGVLITDHNVRETLEIIDRAYILHDGRVLMEGAPEDVVNDENVRRVYLGEGFRI